MPSPRRMRLLMLGTVATVIFIFFYKSGIDPRREPDSRYIEDFYRKTMNAMDGPNRPGHAIVDSKTGHNPADKDGDGDVDEDDKKMAANMQERLRAAEQQAKDKANEKAGLRPDPPSEVVGVGSSAGGQKKKPGAADDDVAAADADSGAAVQKDQHTETNPEVRQAEIELDSILKKSPVVIFSKSYCRFSKRAKGLLLEKYHITPEPLVVELDEHALGPFLQDELNVRTGRRTVPNIMINGVSIGGADDIVDLDNADRLVAKVESLGDGSIAMVERPVPKDQQS